MVAPFLRGFPVFGITKVQLLYLNLLTMAKAAKKVEKPTERKKRGKYEEPLKVNGSFMDIIGAAVKNANDKSATKDKE